MVGMHAYIDRTHKAHTHAFCNMPDCNMCINWFFILCYFSVMCQTLYLHCILFGCVSVCAVRIISWFCCESLRPDGGRSVFLVAMLIPDIQKHCNTCCLLAEQASKIYLLYIQANNLCSLEIKNCQPLNVTVKCNMSKCIYSPQCCKLSWWYISRYINKCWIV